MIFTSETLAPSLITIEDGGQAKILTFETDSDTIFFRIRSWNENNNHSDFDSFVEKFAGKKIKITIDEV